MESLFIGVDVGTGSVRAGLFTDDGRLLAASRHPIRTWREAGDLVEQSSEDIWAATIRCVRGAVAASGADPAAVAGIGFDATCSLVLLDAEGKPTPAGPSGDRERNVIVWMDHRAVEQAEAINATRHAVLSYVGGTISPEMQTPKLLWLRQKLPDAYAAAAHFFDLADFLTYRATGSPQRSVCTLTCKWTYLAHERRWCDDYFRLIGLGDLVDDGYARIGQSVAEPGAPLGNGLSAEAAAAFGLRPGTRVGAALIDAHAGALGTLGGRDAGGQPADPTSRVAFIMGTSTCVMVVDRERRFVSGIWGPYFSALVPGLWLAEGGQSTAGAAIDHLLRLHPAYPEAMRAAQAAGLPLIAHLEREIETHGVALDEAAFIAPDLHILPDLLGNRSPHADPQARGVIAGLSLGDDAWDLCRLYVAGVCGLAYGGAQIVEALKASGYELGVIVVSGGASRSPLVCRIMADAVGIDVALPESEEPVLLGAAMLGAVAAGRFAGLSEAMPAMARTRTTIQPCRGRAAAFHAAKRKVFEAMQQLDREARRAMASVQQR